ncbi:hypothetical protein ZWY2020_009926 [Hordeum vulgare]|nr:hypothetical protein ZWY2020_009926 [Hordeum vulgare]
MRQARWSERRRASRWRSRLCLSHAPLWESPPLPEGLAPLRYERPWRVEMGGHGRGVAVRQPGGYGLHGHWHGARHGRTATVLCDQGRPYRGFEPRLLPPVLDMRPHHGQPHSPFEKTTGRVSRESRRWRCGRLRLVQEVEAAGSPDD